MHHLYLNLNVFVSQKASRLHYRDQSQSVISVLTEQRGRTVHTRDPVVVVLFSTAGDGGGAVQTLQQHVGHG